MLRGGVSQRHRSRFTQEDRSLRTSVLLAQTCLEVMQALHTAAKQPGLMSTMWAASLSIN